LALKYVYLLYRIIASNLQVFPYFFMILAVIMNGGLVYMMYPFLLFAVAFVEEDRPNKVFWYFVRYYTQALFIL